MSTTGAIRLPFPHAGQQFVRTNAKRFNWLSAGRRWRKTTLCMAIAIEAALRGERWFWGSPTFDQTRIGWNETRRAAGDVATFNQGRMTATFPGGGSIIFRSLDDPAHAKGHTSDGTIVDEVGQVKAQAWHETLRPMLMDTGGPAWLIGTPVGHNWFYVEWCKAQDRDDSTAWQIPTLGAEIVDDELIRKPHSLENTAIAWNEIVQLYETMPQRTFQQEILAMFIKWAGSLFRRVQESATAQPLDPTGTGNEYVIGADWGKLADFTVITVLDAKTGAMVAWDRFNMLGYDIQMSRLETLYHKFRPVSVVAEANSMGEPLCDLLEGKGWPIERFTTTNASKAELVDGLQLAFERSEIQIFDEDVLLRELEAYEATRLPSGKLRYAAPDGMHDDCVMSLMLAHHGTQSISRPEFARVAVRRSY